MSDNTNQPSGKSASNISPGADAQEVLPEHMLGPQRGSSLYQKPDGSIGIERRKSGGSIRSILSRGSFGRSGPSSRSPSPLPPKDFSAGFATSDLSSFTSRHEETEHTKGVKIAKEFLNAWVKAMGSEDQWYFTSLWGDSWDALKDTLPATTQTAVPILVRHLTDQRCFDNTFEHSKDVQEAWRTIQKTSEVWETFFNPSMSRGRQKIDNVTELGKKAVNAVRMVRVLRGVEAPPEIESSSAEEGPSKVPDEGTQQPEGTGGMF